MSNSILWLFWLLTWVIIHLTFLLSPKLIKRLGRGCLSRWLVRYRPFKWWGLLDRNVWALYPYARIRFWQAQCLIALQLVLAELGVSDRLVISVYAILVILYLDDYLTGDEDNWRKFKEAVRNRVKWRMELPQPQHD